MIDLAVYLDANVFIFAILGKDSRAEKAILLLNEIAEAKEKAITCSLAIDEVLWKIWNKTNNRNLAIEEAFRIMAIPNLEIVPVTGENMFEALGMMQRYKTLKPRDAIHASVSISRGVYTIISDDADFDDIKELKRLPLISSK